MTHGVVSYASVGKWPLTKGPAIGLGVVAMIRHSVRLLLAAAVAVGASLGIAAPASAEVLHHVYRTDGEGVWLHTVPAIHDGSIDVLSEGAEFRVQCWTFGDDVLGNPVWLYGSSELGSGYVTDYYIDTAWNSTADLEAQGIPHCASPPIPSSPPPSATTSAARCSGDPDGLYVESLATTEEGALYKRVSLQPGPEGLLNWTAFDGDVAALTDTIWAIVDDCLRDRGVPMTGEEASSTYLQLHCHVWAGRYSDAFNGSFDMETWRAHEPQVDGFFYGATQCNW